MEQIAKLEARREQILKEMRGMRTMRKGSVMEQYLKVKKRGGGGARSPRPLLALYP